MSQIAPDDASDAAPSAGATVTGEWLEISIARGAIASRVPRLVATTTDRGWFALCNVPGPGTILLTASRGADSTDVIELNVPSNGLLRRELYLGPARTITGVDTITNETIRLHAGDGQLSGVVLGAADSIPLAGALVSMAPVTAQAASAAAVARASGCLRVRRCSAAAGRATASTQAAA